MLQNSVNICVWQSPESWLKRHNETKTNGIQKMQTVNPSSKNVPHTNIPVDQQILILLFPVDMPLEATTTQKIKRTIVFFFYNEVRKRDNRTFI